ncbi:DUF1127 domain-containing protein [Histidinibacterium lentulum]|nr:DUF1127 domain-containing protein [Histidinibacterium lentulum]
MTTLAARFLPQIDRLGFDDLRASFSAARARRRTYLQVHRELSSSTDRDLADIGISRHDIPEIADRASRGI